MEIFLDKRTVRQIRLSASDAIEDGEFETLREDLIDLFNDEETEEIERRTDSGDIYSFINEILEEWDNEDIEELFELLESQLSDADVELKYASPELDDEEEEDDDDDEPLDLDEEEEEE